MAKTPEGTPAIFLAMTSIMREVEAIGKDRNNAAQGYKFRGIDDVYNALNPLLAKHGVFTVPEVVEAKRDERTTAKGTVLFSSILTMKYTFYAQDGSSVQAVVVGEGMDSGDKATNKAMAVAHKYALLQIFAVPTEEPKDSDLDSHEVKARPVVQQPKPEPVKADTPPPETVHDAVVSELGGEVVGQARALKPSAADSTAFRAKMKKLNVASDLVAKFVKARYNADKPAEMTMEQFEELRDKVLPGLANGTMLIVDANAWPAKLGNEDVPAKGAA